MILTAYISALQNGLDLGKDGNVWKLIESGTHLCLHFPLFCCIVFVTFHSITIDHSKAVLYPQFNYCVNFLPYFMLCLSLVILAFNLICFPSSLCGEVFNCVWGYSEVFSLLSTLRLFFCMFLHIKWSKEHSFRFHHLHIKNSSG